MRTALFVYQETSVDITTSEEELELTGFMGGMVTLCEGSNKLTVMPGVYKVDSSHALRICGDTSVFDVISAKKEHDPAAMPPSRAASRLSSLDPVALQEFLATPDAKQVANP
jgi:hypothetical protein